MALVQRLARNWDPWIHFGTLQNEVNRLFSDVTEPTLRRFGTNPIRVWHNETGAVLSVDAPGFEPNDIDVTVARDTVTIRGTRAQEPIPEEGSYQRRERSTDSLMRVIELPFEVDSDKTAATYQKGVLTLTLVRPETHQPAKIEVKAG